MLFYYQMCLLWLDHSLNHFHAIPVYFWNWAYRFWLELFFLESTYMANLCQVNGDSDFWNKAGQYIFLLCKLLELHTPVEQYLTQIMTVIRCIYFFCYRTDDRRELWWISLYVSFYIWGSRVYYMYRFKSW